MTEYAKTPEKHPLPEEVPGALLNPTLPTSARGTVDHGQNPELASRESQDAHRLQLANALRTKLDQVGSMLPAELAEAFGITPEEVDAALTSLDAREHLKQDADTGRWTR
jgi:hypothetical protein